MSKQIIDETERFFIVFLSKKAPESNYLSSILQFNVIFEVFRYTGHNFPVRFPIDDEWTIVNRNSVTTAGVSNI